MLRRSKESRKELQEMQRAAWQQGYEKAYSDAKAEYAHRLNTMQALVDSLSSGIESEKVRMLRRIAEGFPKVVWGLVRLFFGEHSKEMGKSLLRRLESAVDMLTAYAAGMYPIGVLWGFRDREELESNGAGMKKASGGKGFSCPRFVFVFKNVVNEPPAGADAPFCYGLMMQFGL